MNIFTFLFLRSSLYIFPLSFLLTFTLLLVFLLFFDTSFTGSSHQANSLGLENSQGRAASEILDADYCPLTNHTGHFEIYEISALCLLLPPKFSVLVTYHRKNKERIQFCDVSVWLTVCAYKLVCPQSNRKRSNAQTPEISWACTCRQEQPKRASFEYQE